MVYRCFTEKKPGFDVEARGTLADLRENLGLSGLTGLRIFNRYDVEGIDEALYARAAVTVFSEPPADFLYHAVMPPHRGALLAVEALPGQFDQRADSCAQCLQILGGGERPETATAKIYVFEGTVTDADMERLRGYLINPVEAREASLERPETLKRIYPAPAPVGTVEGLITADAAGLKAVLEDYGLAMDLDDLTFLQAYFAGEEGRDPSVTELRVVDTYWSDHCRHTTFGTHIEHIDIEDPEVRAAFDAYLDLRRETGRADRPVTLMDLGTIGARALKERGLLPELDESEEINACSIRIKAKVDGEAQDWLLMFKNETHNHPTEIEPFGGAATCIGGCIRDPLSGRAYVYQAMRVTGAGDPRASIEETMPGKLPQRKLTITAAKGYSSYGNQIGLATGQVTELYHPGYAAKRMEVGAVVGAAPVAHVVRLRPAPGDLVILVGGRTGRDGCGGATGSSKTHDLDSLAECAAEVQKGNAPEERKIQRLFRRPACARLIKRCNDFGAGGVSVAIGELADGLRIDLSKVPKKYEGLDGTELAISESQERMAVVVAAEDAESFMELAALENLECSVVAAVTESPRMVMELDGRVIVDLSRKFLASNGAVKTANAAVGTMKPIRGIALTGTDAEKLEQLVGDLRIASQRGLWELFDGSVGASAVLSPIGGRTRRTQPQVMASLLPVLDGETETASVMAFGFDPYASEQNPFRGSSDAVVHSAAKLVAAGCDPDGIYLSFQEYFGRLRREPDRWGLPVSALLGALRAQIGLEMAAIGGKDSMSGSFLELDVPPTLISFAVAPGEAAHILSPAFKIPGNRVWLLAAASDDYTGLKANWRQIRSLVCAGTVASAWAVGEGGAAEGIFKMAAGSGVGFEAARSTPDLFARMPGAVLIESAEEIPGATLLGVILEEPEIRLAGGALSLDALVEKWEKPLSGVFPTETGESGTVPAVSAHERYRPRRGMGIRKPLAVIPAFPGTNSEEDTRRAVVRAGGAAEIFVIQNLTPGALEASVDAFAKAVARAQMVIIPGGFSSGDEPDGSAKFIASFFRSPAVTDAVHRLLKERDGLMLGICNGFQALIKLGLVPYGEICPLTEESPTLTYNAIGRHQAGYRTTRVASVKSPWMGKMEVGELYSLPISHGEGRFVAGDALLKQLADGGQIATQYTDERGVPSMDTHVNPNASMWAVEGITSPDGRVLGKMGHTERAGDFVGKNIFGNLRQPLFEGGVAYFA